MSENQHVVPLPAGTWGVKSEGSDDLTDVFDSKADAIDAARSIARSAGVDFIVHGKSGQPFLSPPGSTLDDSSLRAAIRSVGSESRSGRASGAGKSASRKSPVKSAKKSGGAKKSAAKASASRKSSAKKSGARKAKSSKSGAKKTAHRAGRA